MRQQINCIVSVVLLWTCPCVLWRLLFLLFLSFLLSDSVSSRFCFPHHLVSEGKQNGDKRGHQKDNKSSVVFLLLFCGSATLLCHSFLPLLCFPPVSCSQTERTRNETERRQQGDRKETEGGHQRYNTSVVLYRLLRVALVWAVLHPSSASPPPPPPPPLPLLFHIVGRHTGWTSNAWWR